MRPGTECALLARGRAAPAGGGGGRGTRGLQGLSPSSVCLRGGLVFGEVGWE